VEVPRIETERLLLRGYRADDAGPHAEMCADPEVMEFLGGAVEPVHAWRALALHAGHWTLRGYGNWALERRSDGAFVGRAGLWCPEGWPGLEVGWALARPAWGNGYATEAARAAVAWAWDELGAERLLSIIARGNVRSERVAARLGFAPGRDWEVNGQPVVIHELERTKGDSRP
jgi:RimJ/RimL family protein N-acetyltransferase